MHTVFNNVNLGNKPRLSYTKLQPNRTRAGRSWAKLKPELKLNQSLTLPD